jgi:hypothetical protein
VAVCHKGRLTIEISVDALQAHLGHGDSLGACEDSNSVREAKAEGRGNGKSKGNGNGNGRGHGKNG